MSRRHRYPSPLIHPKSMAVKKSDIPHTKHFVLDTNVLIHDPQSMFHFENNIVWIPVEVLEELDRFKAESTTELYGVPAKFIWPELAAMAGGPEALAAKAQAHIAAGEPQQALHFVEIALAADPRNRAALQASIAAHEQLIELTEGKTFDEVGWLETQVSEAKAALEA